jgi:hypothetical protein
MDYRVPSRGLIGFRTEFLTITRGAGIASHVLDGYGPWVGEIRARQRGSLVADRSGRHRVRGRPARQTAAPSSSGRAPRVYAGMVIGEYTRGEDLEVNIVREKKLTNMRMSTGRRAGQAHPADGPQPRAGAGVLGGRRVRRGHPGVGAAGARSSSTRTPAARQRARRPRTAPRLNRSAPIPPRGRRTGGRCEDAVAPAARARRRVSGTGGDRVRRSGRCWRCCRLLRAAPPCSNEPVARSRAAEPTPQPSRPARRRRRRPPAGFNPHLLAHLSPVTTRWPRSVLPRCSGPTATAAAADPTIATSAEVVATEPFTVSYELNLEASWSDNAPIAARTSSTSGNGCVKEPGVGRRRRLPADRPTCARGSGGRPSTWCSRTPIRRGRSCSVNPAAGAPAQGRPRLLGSARPPGGLPGVRGDRSGSPPWTAPAAWSSWPATISTGTPRRVLTPWSLQQLGDVDTVAGLASGDVDIALPEADVGIRTALVGLQPAPHTQAAPQPLVVQLGCAATAVRCRSAGPPGTGGADRPGGDPRRGLPDALPRDAFGLAPSEPGYQPPPRRARRRARTWSRPDSCSPRPGGTAT